MRWSFAEDAVVARHEHCAVRVTQQPAHGVHRVEAVCVETADRERLADDVDHLLRCRHLEVVHLERERQPGELPRIVAGGVEVVRASLHALNHLLQHGRQFRERFRSERGHTGSPPRLRRGGSGERARTQPLQRRATPRSTTRGRPEPSSPLRSPRTARAGSARSSPAAVSVKPGLHVPRKPSVSHSEVCSSVRPGARHSTSTWSAAALEVVRLAVARIASACARCTR